MTTPACCPPGSWPQLLRSKEELNKDDAPSLKGSIVEVTTAAGSRLPIYYVEPDEKKNLGSVMVFPDIYSIRAFNSEVRSGDRIGLICDQLAQAGYTVALPNLFRDKPFDIAINGPKDGNFTKFSAFAQEGGVAWFASQNYDKLRDDVIACAKFLSEKTGAQACAVVGFCFGVWLLSKTSSMGDVDFCCAVGCHPTTALESAVFGGDEIAMMQSLKQPTLFLWAGNDSQIYINDGAGKAALEASGLNGGVVEFPDMLHGWVCRGDVAEENVKRDVEKAFGEIIGFLEKHMPKAE